MTPTVYLMVDPRGWPASLDPEVVNVILQARLLPQLPIHVHALKITDNWPQDLPREESLIFALFTRPLAAGWQNTVSKWLDSRHTLYAMYLDSVDPDDILALANLTRAQAIPRGPC